MSSSRALDARHRVAGGEHRLVLLRARHPGRRAVGDLDQQLELGQAVDDVGDTVAERGVEHERLGVGVVEQVPELLVEVAVVDVDRDAAQLERGVLGLDVLVAVVQVEPDLRVRAEPGGRQRAGDACGPIVELRPGPGGVAVGDGGRVGDLVGDRFPDGCEVHLHRADSRGAACSNSHGRRNLVTLAGDTRASQTTRRRRLAVSFAVVAATIASILTVSAGESVVVAESGRRRRSFDSMRRRSLVRSLRSSTTVESVRFVRGSSPSTSMR